MPSAASPSTVGRMIRSSTFPSMLVGKRNRRYTTHTTGVQPFVAFADAFVVFCFGQNLVVLSIGQNEYGTFYTAQEFFNHYGGGSVTEHSAQHFFQFFLGFFQGGQNQYAFPAQRPSAFSTYGASNVSRKANPSSRFAAVILL